MLNPTLENLRIHLETQTEIIPGDTRRFRDAAPMLTDLSDDLDDVQAKLEAAEEEAEDAKRDLAWLKERTSDKLKELVQSHPEVEQTIEDLIFNLDL